MIKGFRFVFLKILSFKLSKHLLGPLNLATHLMFPVNKELFFNSLDHKDRQGYNFIMTPEDLQGLTTGTACKSSTL